MLLQSILLTAHLRSQCNNRFDHQLRNNSDLKVCSISNTCNAHSLLHHLRCAYSASFRLLSPSYEVPTPENLVLENGSGLRMIIKWLCIPNSLSALTLFDGALRNFKRSPVYQFKFQNHLSLKNTTENQLPELASVYHPYCYKTLVPNLIFYVTSRFRCSRCHSCLPPKMISMMTATEFVVPSRMRAFAANYDPRNPAENKTTFSFPYIPDIALTVFPFSIVCKRLHGRAVACI